MESVCERDRKREIERSREGKINMVQCEKVSTEKHHICVKKINKINEQAITVIKKV